MLVGLTENVDIALISLAGAVVVCIATGTFNLITSVITKREIHEVKRTTTDTANAVNRSADDPDDQSSLREMIKELRGIIRTLDREQAAFRDKQLDSNIWLQDQITSTDKHVSMVDIRTRRIMRRLHEMSKRDGNTD